MARPRPLSSGTEAMGARRLPLVLRDKARRVLPRLALLTLGAGLALNPVAQAQAQASICGRDAMLVFDASSSMAMPRVGSVPARIDEARRALADVLPDIAPLRRIGLMVYGPPNSAGGRVCDGIGLRFEPRSDAASSVTAALNTLQPGGLTPLTASVQSAADALNYRTKPAIIVVITDGSETCGGQPCALGRHLAAEGAHMTVHVVGFRRVRDALVIKGEAKTQERHEDLRCLAHATGGTYVDTETVTELSNALRETLGCLLIG
ncbi:MAG: VWA domain-containing protein [Pseudomonadota bacterium]